MYIRRTQTRNTSTCERYYTHRLVRSERVGGKVKQITLLNLGRHFDVEQAQWPTLCARIEHVGWVERGETHQPNAGIDGFRSSTHPTGLSL